MLYNEYITGQVKLPECDLLFMFVRLPFSIKILLSLAGISLALYLIIFLKPVLVPVIFGALFAFLMLPLCKVFEKARIPRPFAILLCLFIIMLVLALLIWFLSSQLLEFRNELGGISIQIEKMVLEIQQFLQQKFGLKPSSNTDLLKRSLENLSSSGTLLLSTTLAVTAGMLTYITLIPIYFFCMLYYRDHLRRFMFLLIRTEQRDAAMRVLDDIRKVVQSYLSGLAIVILIVSLLNSAGLLILGVKYAIFFGVTASILMIIPYVGMLIGSLLPATYVLLSTGKISTALGVIGIMGMVQFLEGNFITPFIVGSKVRLNAFAAILALVIGGHIWEMAGMILAIPLIAISKVIFDYYAPLRPLGMLLADISESEEEHMFTGIFRKIRNLFVKVPKP